MDLKLGIQETFTWVLWKRARQLRFNCERKQNVDMTSSLKSFRYPLVVFKINRQQLLIISNAKSIIKLYTA